MIPFAAVMGAIKLAGAAAPAFKALFDQVVPLFSETDQAKLKDAYAQARARSDAAHEGLQDAARDAQDGG